MTNFYKLIAFFLLTSCSVPDKDTEEEKLTLQIRALEEQLIECQNERGQVIDQVIDMYHKSNYDSVKILFRELQERYPELHELKEAMDIHYEVIQKETGSISEITAREEAKKRAIRKLKVQREGNIQIYTNTAFKHFNNRNMMSVYITQKGDSSPTLMIKLSYSGNDWIYFKQARLTYNDQTMDIPFDAFEHKETQKDAGVAEWIDAPVNNKIVAFLRPFAKSVKAKMKLTGKFTKSRSLSPKERQAIIEVLDGYEALIASK